MRYKYIADSSEQCRDLERRIKQLEENFEFKTDAKSKFLVRNIRKYENFINLFRL